MSPTESPGAANPRAEDAHRAGDDIVASIAPGGDKRADAERLTQRIQLRLDAIAENVEQILMLIDRAKAENVYEAPGYRSWPEYVTDRFGGRLSRLSRAERQPLVALLAQQGMSVRAIPPSLAPGNPLSIVTSQVSQPGHLRTRPRTPARSSSSRQSLLPVPTATFIGRTWSPRSVRPRPPPR